MSLTAYQQKVLQQEIAKSDYNGMTSAQGFAWLTVPVYQQSVSLPSGVMLTPFVVSKAIGPAKANALASALAAAFPAIAADLLQHGVDPLDTASVQPFLQNLVNGNVITQADMNALVALGTVTQNVGTLQARFDQRFQPANWPSVAADGTIDGTGASPAIHGFINCLQLTQQDFNAAWTAAGRA